MSISKKWNRKLEILLRFVTASNKLLPRQIKLLTAATNKHDQATTFNSGDRGDKQAEECAVVQLCRYTP